MREKLCGLFAFLFVATIGYQGMKDTDNFGFVKEEEKIIEKYIPEGVNEKEKTGTNTIYYDGEFTAVFYGEDPSIPGVRYYVSSLEMTHFLGNNYDVFEKFESILSKKDIEEGKKSAFVYTYFPINYSDDLNTAFPVIIYDFFTLNGKDFGGKIENIEIIDSACDYNVKGKISELVVNGHKLMYEYSSELKFEYDNNSWDLKAFDEESSYVGCYFLNPNKYYSYEELLELQESLNDLTYKNTNKLSLK